MQGIGHTRRTILWALMSVLLVLVLANGGLRPASAAPHDSPTRSDWTPNAAHELDVELANPA